ncbi:MAG: hypothetical protein NTV87_15325 [Ignavibacteriae bacterium]|nr:hypothetical protein [Ignavibacteriota bacterium]
MQSVSSIAFTPAKTVTKAERERREASKQAERPLLTAFDNKLDYLAVLMFFKLCQIIETKTTDNNE